LLAAAIALRTGKIIKNGKLIILISSSNFN